MKIVKKIFQEQTSQGSTMTLSENCIVEGWSEGLRLSIQAGQP
jgi:hypothetical protein